MITIAIIPFTDSTLTRKQTHYVFLQISNISTVTPFVPTSGERKGKDITVVKMVCGTSYAIEEEVSGFLTRCRKSYK
jgi:hypothetical protein